MDGWNTSILVSFWGKRPIFRCELERVSLSSFLVVFHSPKQSPNPNEKQRSSKGSRYIISIHSALEVNPPFFKMVVPNLNDDKPLL